MSDSESDTDSSDNDSYNESDPYELEDSSGDFESDPQTDRHTDSTILCPHCDKGFTKTALVTHLQELNKKTNSRKRKASTNSNNDKRSKTDNDTNVNTNNKKVTSNKNSSVHNTTSTKAPTKKSKSSGSSKQTDNKTANTKNDLSNTKVSSDSFNPQKRPVGRPPSVQKQAVSQAGSTKNKDVTGGQVSEKKITCQYCRATFDRDEFHNYKLHCGERHGVKIDDKNIPPNDPPEVDQRPGDTNNNATVNVNDDIVSNENISRKRRIDDDHTQNKRPRLEDDESSDLTMIIDYLKKNPHKIKALLEILNLNSNIPEHDIRIILYKCKQCEIHIIKKKEFRKHLQGHTKNKFVGRCKCPHCNLDFTVKSMQKHVEVHRTEGVTAANFRIVDEIDTGTADSDTNETAPTSNNAGPSRDPDPTVETYTAEVPTTSKSASENQKEKSTDDGENRNNVTPKAGRKKTVMFQCDDCNVTYLSEQRFNNHVKEETHYKKKKGYKCKVCGLFFSSSKILESHVQIHHVKLKLTLEDFWICTNGHRNLLTVSSRQEQIVTRSVGHENQFNADSNLKIDLHLCTLCGLHFIHKSNVGTHHAREKKYTVEQHRQRNNKTSVVCEICKLKFAIITLDKHMKKHHMMKGAADARDFNIIPFEITDAITERQNRPQDPTELMKLQKQRRKEARDSSAAKKSTISEKTTAERKTSKDGSVSSEKSAKSTENRSKSTDHPTNEINTKKSHSREISTSSRTNRSKSTENAASSSGSKKSGVSGESKTKSEKFSQNLGGNRQVQKPVISRINTDNERNRVTDPSISKKQDTLSNAVQGNSSRNNVANMLQTGSDQNTALKENYFANNKKQSLETSVNITAQTTVNSAETTTSRNVHHSTQKNIRFQNSASNHHSGGGYKTNSSFQIMSMSNYVSDSIVPNRRVENSLITANVAAKKTNDLSPQIPTSSNNGNASWLQNKTTENTGNLNGGNPLNLTLTCIDSNRNLEAQELNASRYAQINLFPNTTFGSRDEESSNSIVGNENLSPAIEHASISGNILAGMLLNRSVGTKSNKEGSAVNLTAHNSKTYENLEAPEPTNSRPLNCSSNVVNSSNTPGISSDQIPTTSNALNEMRLRNETDRRKEQVVALSCRTIRIGSHTYKPIEKVYISPNGVKIIAPKVTDMQQVVIHIPLKDIVKVLARLDGSMPSIFIYNISRCGIQIRSLLGMTEGSGPYYDPMTRHEAHKRIAILLEAVPNESSTDLRRIFGSLLDDINQRESDQIWRAIHISSNFLQRTVLKAYIDSNSQTAGPSTLSNMSIEDTVVTLNCSTVRIGSYIYTPKHMIHVSTRGITIIAPTVTNYRDRLLFIYSCEIVEMRVHLDNRLSVIFIDAIDKCGNFVRKELLMTEGSDIYYDPASNNEAFRTITLLLQNMTEYVRTQLRAVIGNRLREISYTEAEHALRTTQNVEHEANGSLVVANIENSVENRNQEIKRTVVSELTGATIDYSHDTTCRANSEYLNSVKHNTMVDLTARYIKIGSYGYTHKDKIYITEIGVLLSAPSLTNVEDMSLFILIKRATIHSDPAVLVIESTGTYGNYVRNELGMTDGSDVYFDPLSNNEQFRTLTVILENINDETLAKMKVSFGNRLQIMDYTDAVRIVQNITVESNGSREVENNENPVEDRNHDAKGNVASELANGDAIEPTTGAIDQNDEQLVALKCRTIKIGSYSYTPEHEVIVTPNSGISIKAPSLTDNELVTLEIPTKYITKLHLRLEDAIQTMTIYTYYCFSDYIRSELGMVEGSNMYYDPVSRNEAMREVKLFLQKALTDKSRRSLKAMFGEQLVEMDLQIACTLLSIQAETVKKEEDTESANADSAEDSENAFEPRILVDSVIGNAKFDLNALVDNQRGNVETGDVTQVTQEDNTNDNVENELRGDRVKLEITVDPSIFESQEDVCIEGGLLEAKEEYERDVNANELIEKQELPEDLNYASISGEQDANALPKYEFDSEELREKNEDDDLNLLPRDTLVEENIEVVPKDERSDAEDGLTDNKEDIDLNLPPGDSLLGENVELLPKDEVSDAEDTFSGQNVSVVDNTIKNECVSEGSVRGDVETPDLLMNRVKDESVNEEFLATVHDSDSQGTLILVEHDLDTNEEVNDDPKTESNEGMDVLPSFADMTPKEEEDEIPIICKKEESSQGVENSPKDNESYTHKAIEAATQANERNGEFGSTLQSSEVEITFADMTPKEEEDEIPIICKKEESSQGVENAENSPKDDESHTHEAIEAATQANKHNGEFSSTLQSSEVEIAQVDKDSTVEEVTNNFAAENQDALITSTELTEDVPADSTEKELLEESGLQSFDDTFDQEELRAQVLQLTYNLNRDLRDDSLLAPSVDAPNESQDNEMEQTQNDTSPEADILPDSSVDVTMSTDLVTTTDTNAEEAIDEVNASEIGDTLNNSADEIRNPDVSTCDEDTRSYEIPLVDDQNKLDDGNKERTVIIEITNDNGTLVATTNNDQRDLNEDIENKIASANENSADTTDTSAVNVTSSENDKDYKEITTTQTDQDNNCDMDDFNPVQIKQEPIAVKDVFNDRDPSNAVIVINIDDDDDESEIPKDNDEQILRNVVSSNGNISGNNVSNIESREEPNNDSVQREDIDRSDKYENQGLNFINAKPQENKEDNNESIAIKSEYSTKKTKRDFNDSEWTPIKPRDIKKELPDIIVTSMYFNDNTICIDDSDDDVFITDVRKGDSDVIFLDD